MTPVTNRGNLRRASPKAGRWDSEGIALVTDNLLAASVWDTVQLTSAYSEIWPHDPQARRCFLR
jgi:hypothetical protein